MALKTIRGKGLLLLGLASLVGGVSLLGLGLITVLSGSDGPDLGADRSTPYDYNLPVATPFNRPPEGVSLTPTPVAAENAAPLRMVIGSIDVDAPIITLGLNYKFTPEVPSTGYQVSWYDFSAAPGIGSNAVFAGHVSWKQVPAVFSSLNDIREGDAIRLITEEGNELVYEVFANFALDPSDPNSVHVMDRGDEDIITLITCGGSWSPDPSEPFGGNYSERVVVQARLLGAS
ncbi:MAG: class F sortase [Chloroflexi bacterium]|nr:class F sortase [Chloroflexota bacterium]